MSAPTIPAVNEYNLPEVLRAAADADIYYDPSFEDDDESEKAWTVAITRSQLAMYKAAAALEAKQPEPKQPEPKQPEPKQPEPKQPELREYLFWNEDNVYDHLDIHGDEQTPASILRAEQERDETRSTRVLAMDDEHAEQIARVTINETPYGMRYGLIPDTY